MIPALSFLLLVVILGVGIGVPAYARLFRRLREAHPALWESLGRPSMMMASPSRSAGLQRFLYSERAVTTGDPQLTASVRFLRIFAPLLIAAVFGAIGLLLRAVLEMMERG